MYFHGICIRGFFTGRITISTPAIRQDVRDIRNILDFFRNILVKSVNYASRMEKAKTWGKILRL